MTHSHIQSSLRHHSFVSIWQTMHTHTHALRPSCFHARSYTFFLCICLLLFIPVISSFISDKLPAESNRKLRDWPNQECGAVFFFDSYTFTLTIKFPNPPSTPCVHLRQGEFGEQRTSSFWSITTHLHQFLCSFFSFQTGRLNRETNQVNQAHLQKTTKTKTEHELLFQTSTNSSECICVAAVRRSQGVSTLNVCFVQWLALLWLQIETSLFD